MKALPEILVVFLSVSIFAILLLFFLIFLPRFLKKKETPLEHIEMNSVMGAFNALGSEIKSLKEQLVVKERLAALGEVSAGIAHELRNPMAVIAGYAKLLLKDIGESGSKREIVEGILKEIEEMNRVMEELLKFSKAEPLNKSYIELTALIKEIVSGMSEPGKLLEFSGGGAVFVSADATLLKQAVRNLVRNALHAGDRVVVSVENAVSSGGKEEVFISVRDNGRGIAEKDLSKVFMPFYTTREGGSGIGLALVQKIALAHGGRVSVESEEGRGSAFRLFLPKE